VCLVESAAASYAEVADCGVELEFAGADGVRGRAGPAACGSVRFEDAAAARSFRWSRGQGHFPGWWWLATTGRHVGYESWLERDHLMLLDFDPAVTAVSSQPFWLHWNDGRRMRRHAPDFFARLADGTGVVIDVRADDQIEPRDAEAFEVTARACARAGWQFRRVGVTDPVMTVNVRWLSRYRHQRCAGTPEVAGALRRAFAGPACLLAGAAGAGDNLAVLPVLFHLMWRRVLEADLGSGPLNSATVVRLAAGAR
jgi:TnsA-like endonuclease N terminal